MTQSLTEAVARFRKHAESHWTPDKQRSHDDALERQRRESVERLRRQSGVPERFANVRLCELDYRKPNAPAIDAAAALIDGGFKSSLGLYGDVGPGKTTIAAAVVNAACEELVPARMLTVVTLFDQLHAASKYGSDSDVSELVAEFASVPVLLLDDLGREPMQSRQYLAWLYELLNRRWNACKPMLVTSNYTIDGLTERYATYCQRIGESDSTAFSIVDRLCGIVPSSCWIELRGKSRRGAT